MGIPVSSQITASRTPRTGVIFFFFIDRLPSFSVEPNMYGSQSTTIPVKESPAHVVSLLESAPWFVYVSFAYGFSTAKTLFICCG